MRRFLSILTIVLFAVTANSQTTYTFTGNGNWTEAANWSNTTIPPAVLTAGNNIIINPVAGGSSILNTMQTIAAGASLNIAAGARFIISGGVTIMGSIPTITTRPVSNILSFLASSGGIVTSNGGSQVTSAGLVWDTLPNPTLSVTTKTVINLIADSFTNNITLLKPGKTYYVRAYASNLIGTGYGEQQIFTTAAGDSTFTDPRDGQQYTFRHIGSQVWMTQNLNYYTSDSYVYNNDPANGYAFGRLYNLYTALFSLPPGWHLPDTSEYASLVNFLGGTDIAGGSMKANAFWNSPNVGATNSSGFSAIPFGPGGGAMWWLYGVPGTISASNIYLRADYQSAFYAYQGASYSTRAAVRCIRDSIVLPAPPTLASITTNSIYQITAASAKSGYDIQRNGGSPVTACGLVWDTMPNPTVSLTTKTVIAPIMNVLSFYDSLTGLQPATKYYVRAYATNVAGTAYGEELSFSTDWVIDSSFTDVRDGQVYTFRRIGDYVWMTRNFNYAGASASACYDDAPANCELYGRLYTWNDAVNSAPPGWHLPSQSEWYNLINRVVNAGSLKSNSSLWTYPNSGATNQSGFSGLPGGGGYIGGGYYHVGSEGNWWSSTQSGSYISCFSLLANYTSVADFTDLPDKKKSVRYIRNY